VTEALQAFRKRNDNDSRMKHEETMVRYVRVLEDKKSVAKLRVRKTKLNGEAGRNQKCV